MQPGFASDPGETAPFSQDYSFSNLHRKIIIMTTLSNDEKKSEILAHEETMARRLARRVVEKPIPPIWMILVPVFFVFHAWKIKQYSNGLKDFAENYLISRRKALDAAFESGQGDDLSEIERLKETGEIVPPEARAQYIDLMSLLTEHYRALLAVRGKSYKDLVMAHYRNKTNYLLFCNRLNKTENSYNLRLLPRIEGDSEDLRHIINKMDKDIQELRRAEADEFFP
jgi:hypothetical protein